MRTTRPLLAGAICLAMAGALPIPAVAQDDEVTLVGPLVYATGRAPHKATELTLELFAAGSEDAPMVVSVAGWAHAEALAAQGVSVFVVFYRDRWSEVEASADPTAVRSMAEAVACAVRFARGSEYGSETAPLVLTGFSKQGGLAAHVALAGESFDRVWDEYAESAGGPPAQWECAVDEGSTRVDGLVGIAGTYDTFTGYEGRYGRDFLLEHRPDLWEMLRGTVGLHPELRVRLIHGESDVTIPLETSAAFETVLSEAGYDVELLEHDGDHIVPYGDLVPDTVMELVE